MSDFIRHATRAAVNDKTNPKLSGVILIVIGMCFTPWLVGIPIVLYGFYKLFSSPTKVA
jgi:hypothetical protein